jgi:hypothetical protein
MVGLSDARLVAAMRIAMLNEFADWASVLSLIIAVASIAWGWRQRNQRQHQTETFVAFLHGLKTSIHDAKVLDQINDMLARLDPPAK